MDKGFVIFRDPDIGTTIGWQGQFLSQDIFQPGSAKQFYLQPWSPSGGLTVLHAEQEETDTSVLRQWTDSLVIASEPSASETSKEAFTTYINFIKTGIAQGDFDKVVASRSRFINRPEVSLMDIFEAVCANYVQTFVSLVFHPQWGCWMGASPELFLRIDNGTLETVALAGTLIRQEEQWTEKERTEQHTIAIFIDGLFQQFHATDVVKEAIQTTVQGNLQHLSEKYRFQIAEEKVPDFVQTLHPTPAVGGYPQTEAVSFINRFENLERGLFTGWLGYSNTSKFNSYVNLRCAKIYSNKVQLFAGCGINSGSDPDKEWLETEAKMQVLGRFFALADY